MYHILLKEVYEVTRKLNKNLNKLEYKLINCIKTQVVNGKIYQVRKDHWFQIAEVVEYKSPLHLDKVISDQILIDSDSNVYLYRDIDVYYEGMLSIDEVSDKYDDTQNKEWRSEERRLKLEEYYSMILLKMRKYDRERIINYLLDEEKKYYDQLILCC